MSIGYRLHINERLSDGVRRVIRALHDQSIDHTKNLSNPHEAVHELRKRFKEIRALLRLVRDNIGEENYKEANIFYRDLGRYIADIRDAKAHLEMIDLLKQKYDSKLYKNAFQHTEKVFIEQLETIEAEMNLKRKLLSIKGSLKEKSNIFNSLPIEANSFEDIEKSLLRVYKRGYRGLANVKKEPSPNNLHEWRKRAKYMMYQLDVLKIIWPDMLHTMEGEFHKLSDILGNDHDLTNLLKKLERLSYNEEELELIKALANNERLELEKKAINLGEKLYAENPDQFIGRIKKYYLAHANSYTTGHYIPQINTGED